MEKQNVCRMRQWVKSARHRCLFSVSPPPRVWLAGGYISGEGRCAAPRMMMLMMMMMMKQRLEMEVCKAWRGRETMWGIEFPPPPPPPPSLCCCLGSPRNSLDLFCYIFPLWITGRNVTRWFTAEIFEHIDHKHRRHVAPRWWSGRRGRDTNYFFICVLKGPEISIRGLRDVLSAKGGVSFLRSFALTISVIMSSATYTRCFTEYKFMRLWRLLTFILGDGGNH